MFFFSFSEHTFPGMTLLELAKLEEQYRKSPNDASTQLKIGASLFYIPKSFCTCPIPKQTFNLRIFTYLHTHSMI